MTHFLKAAVERVSDSESGEVERLWVIGLTGGQRGGGREWIGLSAGPGCKVVWCVFQCVIEAIKRRLCISSACAMDWQCVSV